MMSLLELEIKRKRTIAILGQTGVKLQQNDRVCWLRDFIFWMKVFFVRWLKAEAGAQRNRTT